MVKLRADILKNKAELNRYKARVEKYRIILIQNFYSGEALLLLTLWWILFPPEQSWWRLASHICLMFLCINLWVSYWLICRLKLAQKNIDELRIKLLQLVWEKICDCEHSCDCSENIRREITEECNTRSDGIIEEVKQGNELS